MKDLVKFAALLGLLLCPFLFADCKAEVAIPNEILAGQARSQGLLDSRKLGWLTVGEESYAAYFPDVFEKVVELYKAYRQVPSFGIRTLSERDQAIRLAREKIDALRKEFAALAKQTQRLERSSTIIGRYKEELRKKTASLVFNIFKRAQRKLEIPERKPTGNQDENAKEMAKIRQYPMPQFSRSLKQYFIKRTDSLLAEVLAVMVVNGVYYFDCLAKDRHLLGETFTETVLQDRLAIQELDAVGVYREENLIVEVKNRLNPLTPLSDTKAQLDRLLRLRQYSVRPPKLLLISFSGFSTDFYTAIARSEFQGVVLVGPKDPLTYDPNPSKN